MFVVEVLTRWERFLIRRTILPELIRKSMQFLSILDVLSVWLKAVHHWSRRPLIELFIKKTVSSGLPKSAQLPDHASYSVRAARLSPPPGRRTVGSSLLTAHAATIVLSGS